MHGPGGNDAHSAWQSIIDLDNACQFVKLFPQRMDILFVGSENPLDIQGEKANALWGYLSSSARNPAKVN
ncbi:MAG: hypothetical protein C4293_06095 [Nitrospiraceae bacterium]